MRYIAVELIWMNLIRVKTIQNVLLRNATSHLVKFNEEFKYHWACGLKKIVLYEKHHKKMIKIILYDFVSSSLVNMICFLIWIKH